VIVVGILKAIAGTVLVAHVVVVSIGGAIAVAVVLTPVCTVAKIHSLSLLVVNARLPYAGPVPLAMECVHATGHWLTFCTPELVRMCRRVRIRHERRAIADGAFVERTVSALITVVAHVGAIVAGVTNQPYRLGRYVAEYTVNCVCVRVRVCTVEYFCSRRHIQTGQSERQVAFVFDLF